MNQENEPSTIPLATDAPPPALAAEAVEPKGPTFAELGLHPDVLSAVEAMGFAYAMPVQAKTFPLITAGKDLMVQSRTGSGKTAAFGIPMANGIVNPDDKFVQAIILLPTRELALQVAAELTRICANRPVTVVPVYGGAPMGRQVEQLRDGGQIVCGTPGRVRDHIRRGTLKLDRVRVAVLDECDEMLSMGFQEDIEKILEETPTSRQTLLFSATVPEGIQRISRRFLRNPEFLKLSADYVGVHEIKHLYYSIPAISRENELLQILTFEDPKSAIIFCNTREETGRVAEFLRKHGHDAEAISSDLAQSDRERVLGRMRAGGIKFLVATDVAARGIDIEALSHVFNYTFPESPEVYVHRTGRTGRAGKSGTAISLIGPTEVGSFYYLKLLYKIKPEERALPSEAEIRSRREGERVEILRGALAGEPGNEWRGLARRLTNAVDGERLIAALLARGFADVEHMPKAPVAAPVVAATTAPAREERSEGERPRERDRDRDRDRPRFGDRDRPRSGDRDRPRFGDRDRPRERGEGSRGPRGEGSSRRPERRGPAPLRNDAPPAEKDFWEVWSEEKTATAEGAIQAEGVVPDAAEITDVSVPSDPAERPARPPRERAERPRGESRGEDVPPGQTRLYLNLGRKDGASERDIGDLLTAHAELTAPPTLDIMNTHTYVNVPSEDADRVCAALTGKELGGRALVCEPAKPRRR
ncbi:MAG TPA: DEAD/DEAH box helicase [Polyangia bacterium]|nr:DEAD/DEAH box helicase [Polyangia bacterium]